MGLLSGSCGSGECLHTSQDAVRFGAVSGHDRGLVNVPACDLNGALTEWTGERRGPAQLPAAPVCPPQLRGLILRSSVLIFKNIPFLCIKVFEHSEGV